MQTWADKNSSSKPGSTWKQTTFQNNVLEVMPIELSSVSVYTEALKQLNIDMQLVL